MEVQVEYEYVAQEPDELTLKKGEILTNVVQKLDGWWEGNLGSKRGLFPDNFVKVISPESQSVKEEEVFTETVKLRKKPHNRKLKALFSYSPEQDDELTLQVGDVIDFISEVEDGWWKGSLNGRTGIFPSNFVEDSVVPTTNGTGGDSKLDVKQNDKNQNRATFIVKGGTQDSPSAEKINADEEPAPKLPPKPVREVARCFYPYAAQNEDELELQEGDIVTIISKNCEDEGWWRGELRGKTGLFPDNFVKIIPTSELQTATNTSTTKITAQAGDAPIPAAKKEPHPPPADSADGCVSSKAKDVVTRKLTPTREPPTGPPPLKPNTPTSPMSPASLGFTYLPPVSLKVIGKKDSLVKKEQENLTTDDPIVNELSEFNAVERSEKQLNHLTAKRAKAPKRRPPSTLLPRETENEENGLGNSPESPVESPHQNNNAFFPNHNGGSISGNNTSSGFNASSSTPEASNLSTPGSRLSYSRELDNNISASSFNSPVNTTPTSIAPQPAKPKVLPWMQELKQNQEKKRLATSPNPPVTTSSSVSPIPSVANTNTVSSSSSPTGMFTSAVLKPKEKEPLSNLPPAVPAKAPPLPAKPIIPPEKSFSAPSANSHVTSAPTSTSSTVSTVSMKFGRKISPSAANSNYVNTVVTTSNNVNSTVSNHTSNNHAAPQTNNNFSKTNSSTDTIANASLNKGFGNHPETVSYDDYAKLKDRVHLLESELDAVKNQLKLLLDRDMSKGHIV